MMSAASTAAAASSTARRRLTPKDPAYFLSQVEETVRRVLARYPGAAAPHGAEDAAADPSSNTHKKKRKRHHQDGRNGTDLDQAATATRLDNTTGIVASPSDGDLPSLIPPCDREMVGIARSLSERICRANDRNDCPRCWFPGAHCICAQTPPATGSEELRKVDKLFLLMHQKEICLTVDTAKMILAAYPTNCRLVVAGIGSEYQDSMREMEDDMRTDPSSFVVLFPSEDSTTVAESTHLQSMLASAETSDDNNGGGTGGKVNVVVIDGTWAQARRIYQRYVSTVPGLTHIKLTDRALAQIAGNHDGSRQLRPHPEAWREIGTCAATRYLLQDLEGVEAAATKADGDDDHRGHEELYGDHILARYQAYVNEVASKLKAQKGRC